MRVGANGKKTFLFQARVNGRVFRETIGRYGDWTIDGASDEAKIRTPRIVEAKKKDADPIAERRAAKAQGAENKAEAEHTFAVAIEQWRRAALKAGRRPAYIAHAVSAAGRIFADLLDRPVAEITRKRLQTAVDDAEEKRVIDRRIVGGGQRGSRRERDPEARGQARAYRQESGERP